MKDIVKVALNLPLYGTYSYRISDELHVVRPGMRVKVPFGRKMLVGVCVEIEKNNK